MAVRGRNAPAPARVAHGTREEEIALYCGLYGQDNYGMGRRRQESVQAIVADISCIRVGGGAAEPVTLLDVSTGRGETLRIAESFGLRTMGTEVVPDLVDGVRVVFAEAHSLPFEDGAFDHVTCFDVLEHLVEADVAACLRELRRVARVSVTASASERPSVFGDRDLHISKRPAAEWQALMVDAWGGATQIRPAGGSPCWQYLIPPKE